MTKFELGVLFFCGCMVSKYGFLRTVYLQNTAILLPLLPFMGSMQKYSNGHAPESAVGSLGQDFEKSSIMSLERTARPRQHLQNTLFVLRQQTDHC